MPLDVTRQIHRPVRTLRRALLGPQIIAFMPALTLGAFWIGGEAALMVVAFAIPCLYALTGAFGSLRPVAEFPTDPATGLPLQAEAEARLDALLSGGALARGTVALVALRIDDFAEFAERAGAKARAHVLALTAHRLQSCLRDGDVVFRRGDGGFGIALTFARRADLETMIQLSGRLQTAVSEPISLDASRIYITVSVGFCTPDRLHDLAPAAMIEAAELALNDARANGAGSVRAYASDTGLRARARTSLAEDLAAALDADQIRPWFQPQASTGTGEITGAEALARWLHPTRGMIPPADFLPLVEEAGLSERLGERILHHSLAALTLWDRQGLAIPRVSVNFATEELRNPRIVDRLRWELDRFELPPDRLTVEVLETVIASTRNDVLVRNLWQISELGCGIDLDDFGTGHAAIGNIRRFAVGRIKIDRSFVTRIDLDEDQQNMVAAIVTMASRLNLDTLAEGVETLGELSALSRLGCHHAQGFAIARPMPPDAMLDWVASRRPEAASQVSAKVRSVDPTGGGHGKTA